MTRRYFLDCSRGALIPVGAMSSGLHSQQHTQRDVTTTTAFFDFPAQMIQCPFTGESTGEALASL